MLNKLIVITMTLLLTVGCTWFKPEKEIVYVNIDPPPTIHPDRPYSPEIVHRPHFETLTPDTRDAILTGPNYVYMILSWQDYLSLGQSEQITNHHIYSLNALLCHYRQELNEDVCKPYLDRLDQLKSETETETDEQVNKTE